MGYEDPVMLILHHHHTMVSTHRIVAVYMTLRYRLEGKQLLKYLLFFG